MFKFELVQAVLVRSDQVKKEGEVEFTVANEVIKEGDPRVDSANKYLRAHGFKIISRVTNKHGTTYKAVKI